MKTLFYGGNIITMEETLHTDAVLVENGKILAVGSENELRKRAGECREVNLSGHTMLPAFIDPHSHFFQVAASLLQVSLDGISDTGIMRQKIQKFIEENHIPKGQWVNARDYDNNIMPGLHNPTLSDLDQFAPENPLVIHHKSGHMGLMNSAALREIGITADTPSPDGGKIEKRDGKLTGYMEENAFFDALKKVPMASPDQLLNAFEGAQKKYASYGITTVQDGMVVAQMLPMYQLLLAKKMLKLDVKLYASVVDYQAVQDLLKQFPDNKRLKCGGLKMFLDGSPQGRTAWMRKPYEGENDYCAYGTMTDDAVTAAFIQAADAGTQIIAHCNGDAAAEQFLRCLEIAEKTHPELKKLRPVIIHGQLMGCDQLPKAAELGAMVSFFVAHVYHWGDVHIRNFGMERARHISPAASAAKAGVTYTFHQDAPVIEPDMLETLWCAANRITKNGVFLGDAEKISVLDALKAVTVNAAYQYSEEDIKGSIAQGKLADFVVLDHDPLNTDPGNLRDIQVLETYKEGKLIFSKN